MGDNMELRDQYAAWKCQCQCTRDASIFSVYCVRAQSMVYSQLYSVAMTATSGALYTFDTSATEADYQLKFFVNAGTSFHAQIYDASGVCRLDRIFTKRNMPVFP